MTEDLRVDTGLVLEAGGKLDAIAAAIPEPPTAFSPTGADALSTAIAGKVAEVVDPVLAQMPEAKAALTRYAQNVMQAARAYDSADRQLAEEILKRVEAFDKSVGSQAAADAGQQADAAAQQVGQFGQMMQMPMQLAQQAAQIPMQVAGMAAAVPQAVMQGVQGAVQQAGQTSDVAGSDGLEAEDESQRGDEAVEKEREEQEREERPDGAAPGDTAGERVPESPRVEMPAEPAAPTRPAESSSEIAL